MDNKNLIIGGVAFILGAAAGGAGVYFYSKRYFQEKADADIKEMADYYNEKYADDILKKKEEKSNDSENTEEGDEEKQPTGIQSNAEDISSLYQSRDQFKSEPEAYKDYFNSKPNSNKKKKKKVIEESGPVIVDADYWDNPPEGYSTQFLVYYEVDGVMIDEESDSIFENGVKLIGQHNLDQADAFDNVIIVMDKENKKLYHVTVEQMAFSEVGIDD